MSDTTSTTPSLFAPFAEAIRDGHRIAYGLPAKPAQRPLTADEQALQSAAAELTAYYDRPNGYSGD